MDQVRTACKVDWEMVLRTAHAGVVRSEVIVGNFCPLLTLAQDTPGRMCFAVFRDVFAAAVGLLCLSSRDLVLTHAGVERRERERTVVRVPAGVVPCRGGSSWGVAREEAAG